MRSYCFKLLALVFVIVLSVSNYGFTDPLTKGMKTVKVNKACKELRLSDVGWSDITVTTALVSELLERLGYKTDTKVLSLSVTYLGLAKGSVDVFLGQWIPTMANLSKKYSDQIEVIGPNLVGAKYTLAVPSYAYKAGLKSFKDIVKFKDKLNSKIYGIEAGNDGNVVIANMIDKNKLGLGNFHLVESSEQGMLSQVNREIRKKNFIVFLGWAPHPMNTKFDIKYLEDGDDFFGSNYGEAKVYTVLRKGLSVECPNVKRFLSNVKFSVDIENQLMRAVELTQDKNYKAIVSDFIDKNPEIINGWLKGVARVSD